MTDTLVITRLNADELAARTSDLAGLLVAVVEDGGAIGFVLPLALSSAETYWRERVAPMVQSDGVELYVAMLAGQIAGTVQLVLATPPNQPHRADICKLMVHPDARRKGVARQLMQTALSAARSNARTLVTLDTRTGDGAQALYTAMGFETVGVIPQYALDPDRSVLHSTTIMYRDLTDDQ